MKIKINRASLALCAACLFTPGNVDEQLRMNKGFAAQSEILSECKSLRPVVIVAGPDGGPKRSYITP